MSPPMTDGTATGNNSFKLNDPVVDVEAAEKYKLAFMMHFFMQNKQRFKFPRLRLQDLYQIVLRDSDVTAYADLVVRILRYLQQNNPEITIESVDKSLDNFIGQKRTSHRVSMQRLRAGKTLSDLNWEVKAQMLNDLIESIYDEQPDFSFSVNSAAGASNNAEEDSSLIIKAGQDEQGCYYYYMDVVLASLRQGLNTQEVFAQIPHGLPKSTKLTLASEYVEP